MRYLIAAILAIISMPVIATSTLTEWAHGWKTEYVTATRYNDPIFGYYIGFDLPKNGYDSDRVDMAEWLNNNGVHILQSGGAPFATIFATADGVTDKESADMFLKRFLPKFDAWVRKNLRKDNPEK